MAMSLFTSNNCFCKNSFLDDTQGQTKQNFKRNGITDHMPRIKKIQTKKRINSILANVPGKKLLQNICSKNIQPKLFYHSLARRLFLDISTKTFLKCRIFQKGFVAKCKALISKARETLLFLILIVWNLQIQVSKRKSGLNRS